jgi:hypothetical protein
VVGRECATCTLQYVAWNIELYSYGDCTSLSSAVYIYECTLEHINIQNTIYNRKYYTKIACLVEIWRKEMDSLCSGYKSQI